MTVSFIESTEVFHTFEPLETALWSLEDKVIPAYVIPITHPTLQHGVEYDLYERITAAELYGVLRSNSIKYVLFAQTSPIMGCICAFNWAYHYFVIDSLEHSLLLEYYLRGSPEKTDWKEEGF